MERRSGKVHKTSLSLSLSLSLTHSLHLSPFVSLAQTSLPYLSGYTAPVRRALAGADARKGREGRFPL